MIWLKRFVRVRRPEGADGSGVGGGLRALPLERGGAAPHRFLRKLHDVIGAEATDAMADWMNRTDEKFDELHADLAELRHEMNVKFADVEARAAQRHADVMQRFADLAKWMLGFWVLSLVTYVGAVVALANVLK
jgi:hypothetical protein